MKIPVRAGQGVYVPFFFELPFFSSSQSVRKVSVEQPFGVFSRIYRRRWILIVRIPKVVMAADDRRQVFNLF